jgi:hypothetical protein
VGFGSTAGRARDRDGDRGATVRDLAMRALPLIMDTTVPGTRKAIAILTRATELDPTNACPAPMALWHAIVGSRVRRSDAALGARRGSRRR